VTPTDARDYSNDPRKVTCEDCLAHMQGVTDYGQRAGIDEPLELEDDDQVEEPAPPAAQPSQRTPRA
jgi:hypothetical protein